MIKTIIKALANNHECSHDAAVQLLADHLNRSRMTVYGYLSGKPVPANTLLLLKLNPPK